MKLLVSAILTLTVMGCSTIKAAKTSNASFLSEEQPMDPKVTYEEAIEDLSRAAYVKKELAKEQMENRNSNKPEFLNTDTWIRIYPYTVPTIKLQNKKIIAEQGFKEKWTDEQINSKIEVATKKSISENITKKQCFGLEINSKSSESLNMKYWHGSLIQGAKEDKLTFSAGEGFVQTTKHTNISGRNGYYTSSSYNTEKYFYFAHACTSKPIKITEPFTLKLEPRFREKLQVLNLEWLGSEAPKPAKK